MRNGISSYTQSSLLTASQSCSVYINWMDSDSRQQRQQQQREQAEKDFHHHELNEFPFVEKFH